MAAESHARTRLAVRLEHDASGALRPVCRVRSGIGVDRATRDGAKVIYHENNKNVQPRVGFAWDPFRTERLRCVARTEFWWTSP